MHTCHSKSYSLNSKIDNISHFATWIWLGQNNFARCLWKCFSEFKRQMDAWLKVWYSLILYVYYFSSVDTNYQVNMLSNKIEINENILFIFRNWFALLWKFKYRNTFYILCLLTNKSEFAVSIFTTFWVNSCECISVDIV